MISRGRVTGRLLGLFLLAVGLYALWLPWNANGAEVPIFVAFAPLLVVLGCWCVLTGPDVSENASRDGRDEEREPSALHRWLLGFGLFASAINALVIAGVWNRLLG